MMFCRWRSEYHSTLRDQPEEARQRQCNHHSAAHSGSHMQTLVDDVNCLDNVPQSQQPVYVLFGEAEKKAQISCIVPMVLRIAGILAALLMAIFRT